MAQGHFMLVSFKVAHPTQNHLVMTTSTELESNSVYVGLAF